MKTLATPTTEVNQSWFITSGNGCKIEAYYHSGDLFAGVLAMSWKKELENYVGSLVFKSFYHNGGELDNDVMVPAPHTLELVVTMQHESGEEATKRFKNVRVVSESETLMLETEKAYSFSFSTMLYNVKHLSTN